jgi:DNA-binding GntR family transcriptional regulator
MSQNLTMPSENGALTQFWRRLGTPLNRRRREIAARLTDQDAARALGGQSTLARVLSDGGQKADLSGKED